VQTCALPISRHRATQALLGPGHRVRARAVGARVTARAGGVRARQRVRALAVRDRARLALAAALDARRDAGRAVAAAARTSGGLYLASARRADRGGADELRTRPPRGLARRARLRGGEARWTRVSDPRTESHLLPPGWSIPRRSTPPHLDRHGRLVCGVRGGLHERRRLRREARIPARAQAQRADAGRSGEAAAARRGRGDRDLPLADDRRAGAPALRVARRAQARAARAELHQGDAAGRAADSHVLGPDAGALALCLPPRRARRAPAAGPVRSRPLPRADRRTARATARHSSRVPARERVADRAHARDRRPPREGRRLALDGAPFLRGARHGAPARPRARRS